MPISFPVPPSIATTSRRISASSESTARISILGQYDSAESWEKYHRLIAEWLAKGGNCCLEPTVQARVTIQPLDGQRD